MASNVLVHRNWIKLLNITDVFSEVTVDMKFNIIIDADDLEFSKIFDVSKHYLKFIGRKFDLESILIFLFSALKS